jgi:hypothetical protein
LIIVIILINSFSYEIPIVDRESSIHGDIVKVNPTEDMFPPKLHSDEYEEPVPMEYPINTVGAEDSAFITPDGSTFYFFFTPDVRIPVEKQVNDGITGIYVSRKVNDKWIKPENITMELKKKLMKNGKPSQSLRSNKMRTAIHFLTQY